MLIIPENLDQMIAENLRRLCAAPGEKACFDFIYSLFLDGRMYNLHDEDVPEDWRELEMVSSDYLSDHIYELVHPHPDPLVRSGWLIFCRQTRSVNMRSSVNTFLKDKDPQIKSLAQDVHAELSVEYDRYLAGSFLQDDSILNAEQVRLVLSDLLFPDRLKRRAIDWVWSFSDYSKLSDFEKSAYNEQRQPALWEMMPLLMQTFQACFAGGERFKLHLDYVMSRAEPMSDSLIEQKKNGLLYRWSPDSTGSYAHGLIHAPAEKRAECLQFVHDVLGTDFYRLGKLIILHELEKAQSPK